MDVVIADGFWKGFKRICRPWYHPANLWYSFKCWAWKRHTTIKPRYLSHTWHDRCVILPHMMFEILSQFIEGECGPDGHVEWYGENAHMITVAGEEKYVRDEMQELYDWWHKKYNKRYEELAEYIHEEREKLDLISHFQDIPDRPGICQWKPTYGIPEDAQRAKELSEWYSFYDIAVENSLKRHMHRLVAIYRSMWT